MSTSDAILRVVRMEFRPEACAAFDALFAAERSRIAASPGCIALACVSDAAGGSGRTTLSVWRTAEDLVTYRDGEVFRGVWQQAKRGFAHRPVAWSMVVDAAFIATAAAYLGPPNDSPCWP